MGTWGYRPVGGLEDEAGGGVQKPGRLMSKRVEQAWGFPHIAGPAKGLERGKTHVSILAWCASGQGWETLTGPGSWVCGRVESQANTSAKCLVPSQAGRALGQHITPLEDWVWSCRIQALPGSGMWTD